MPWTITTPILIWAVTTIVLMALMWFKQPDNKLTGILFALDFLLYYIFWVECVNWVIFNYWIWLIPIPFIIVLLFHYRRRFDRPTWVGKVPWLPGKNLRQPYTLWRRYRADTHRGLRGFPRDPVIRLQKRSGRPFAFMVPCP